MLMIQNVLDTGLTADYVLMDSWFTTEPMIKAILDKRLHTIGMVKQLKQRYSYKDQDMSLAELRATLSANSRSEIIGSRYVQTKQGIPVKIVFIQNRNNKREWLAILTTDTTLEDQEIIRIYGMRWSIEVFFKSAKSLLKLGSEFQGRNYDMFIAQPLFSPDIFCWNGNDATIRIHAAMEKYSICSAMKYRILTTRPPYGL